MIATDAPDIGTLLATVTPRLARLATPAAADAATVGRRDAERARVLHRVLEEWGVSCRESSDLTVLEAFGVASGRGVEVTVAADLAPRARALAYARCLVRLALGDGRAFATWFDYRPGHAPEHRTAEERRGAAAVDSMARALLAGRLEAAPRYLLAAPHAAMEPDGASGLLGGCSRALLGGLHRASSALYWRSDSYQALRASEPMVRFTAGVHALLSLPGAPRAA
jgi:hypothetical protein